MNVRAIGLATIVVVSLACNGLRNDSSMNACKYLVTALREGDREAVAKVNHSDAYAFPTDHLMKYSPLFQDADPQHIQYEQKDDRAVTVRLRNRAGKEHELTFYFLREKDGYFFVSMS